jgi:hypothetical protein
MLYRHQQLNTMPRETLLGMCEPETKKPETTSDIVIVTDEDGNETGHGEVFYYMSQGVKYVTKMDGCAADDLQWHFKGQWEFHD